MLQTLACSSSTYFQKNKYVILESLLVDPLLTFAYKYAKMKAITRQMRLGDEQVPGALTSYADSFMEILLDEMRPHLELATGLQLFPTYSYFRIYKNGDVLKKHKDRAACEISATLTLGSDSSTQWPIYLETPEGDVEVKLKAGDALIYRGCEIPHWREAFHGTQQTQVFLHYVDKNRLSSEWRFDKRLHLGFRQRKGEMTGT
jgi:hypothetical protein